MAFIKKWWYGDSNGDAVIPAASVVDRNYAQQKSLEVKAQKAEHEARKCRENAKKARIKSGIPMAKQLLMQAKIWDRQALQLRQQITSLASQGLVLDAATTNAEVAALMKESLHTGQSAMNGLDVDDIEAVADDWEDLTTDSFEIGKALSRPMGLGFEDEEGIDNELAQLTEVAHLEKSELVLDAMPAAPTSVPTNNKHNNGGNGNAKITKANKVTL